MPNFMPRARGARTRRRRRRRRAGLSPAGRDAHALQHALGLVLRDRVLEGDVARREPHLLVAALLLEAGLVPGVGLVQASIEVGHRGAADVLVETALKVGDERV